MLRENLKLVIHKDTHFVSATSRTSRKKKKKKKKNQKKFKQLWQTSKKNEIQWTTCSDDITFFFQMKNTGLQSS